jgi:TM2 domain-containing membrane protein YozV
MAEQKCIDVSKKNRSVALVLCLLFGWLGLHRFYVDKHGTGLLMMFTIGGFFVWYFVDLIYIIAGTYTDNDGLTLHNWY